MRRRIKYTDEPMGQLKVIKDFLPPPEQLILKEDNLKVTISLSKSSIDFFKKAGGETSHLVPENDPPRGGLLRISLPKGRLATYPARVFGAWAPEIFQCKASKRDIVLIFGAFEFKESSSQN